MGMYTTQVKTICESIIMHKNIEYGDEETRQPTVDDLLNDPAYEYTYKSFIPDFSPYELCYDDSVQARIFERRPYMTDPEGKSKYLYELFDNSYRKELQGKILLHYYTREICEETFALWKLRLISKLKDIMPYYNGLYTETFEKYLGNDYNLFDNVDLTDTEDFDKKLERLVDTVLSEKMKNKGSSSSAGSETHSGTDTTKYKKHFEESPSGLGYTDNRGNDGTTKVTSDTPQGSVSFNVSDTTVTGYASKVEKEIGTITKRQYDASNKIKREYLDLSNSQDELVHGHSVSNTENTTDKNERNTDTTTNENEYAKEENKTTKRTKGKANYQTYTSILKEIRENIINIDKMIIDELEPLFFGLW